jgi:hypothetical protein
MDTDFLLEDERERREIEFVGEGLTDSTFEVQKKRDHLIRKFRLEVMLRERRKDECAELVDNASDGEG